MKHRKFTSLLCGGVLSLAASSLLAQQPSSSDTSSSSANSPLGQSSAVRSGSSSAYSSTSSMHSGSNLRLSQIMNSTVQSQEGKTLGHIRDLMIDPQSGRIQFAVLSLSSSGAASDTATAGRETVPSSRSSTVGTPSSAAGATATGKLIPVPWLLFSQSWSGSQSSATTSTTTPGTTSGLGSHNLVLNIDESKLRSAPSFDMSDWNQLQQGSMDQRVYSYFGVDRSSSGIGTPGSSISGQGASGSSLDSTSPNSNRSTPPQSSSSNNPDK